MRTPEKCAAACLIFTLTLGLNACRPAADSPPSDAVAPAPAQPVEPSTTPAPTEAMASDATVAAGEPATTTSAAVTPAAATVLASADGEKAGVRVEVTELKRSSGDMVSLKFVLINDSAEDLNFGGGYLGQDGVASDYRTVGGVHLVDPVGKKKYLVVRDAETKCVCSTEMDNAKPKSRVNLWTKLPAPPADVQKVNIVIPHFSPMDDVPISQ